MQERDLYLAQQYQREILYIAERAHWIRESKGSSRPNLWDYTLLRAGNALIYLGEKMRSASDYTKPVDLAEECA
jgi:hypothetical protein